MRHVNLYDLGVKLGGKKTCIIMLSFAGLLLISFVNTYPDFHNNFINSLEFTYLWFTSLSTLYTSYHDR